MSDDENSSNRQKPASPWPGMFGSPWHIDPRDLQTGAALLRSLCSLMCSKRGPPPQSGDRYVLFAKLGRLWVAFGPPLGRLWPPSSPVFRPSFQTPGSPLVCVRSPAVPIHSRGEWPAENLGWHQTALFRTRRHQIHFFKPVHMSAVKCRWVRKSADKCRSAQRRWNETERFRFKTERPSSHTNFVGIFVEKLSKSCEAAERPPAFSLRSNLRCNPAPAWGCGNQKITLCNFFYFSQCGGFWWVHQETFPRPCEWSKTERMRSKTARPIVPRRSSHLNHNHDGNFNLPVRLAIRTRQP
jgi:hypothetical protein